MQLISIKDLLLVLLIASIYSIQLSSQSGVRENMGPPSPKPNLPEDLPSPYYYNTNGEIRARGHPNAVPIIANHLFTGMVDGEHYFPIVHDNKVIAIDIRTHKRLEISREDARVIREVAETQMNIFRNAHSANAPSSSRNH